MSKYLKKYSWFSVEVSYFTKKNIVMFLILRMLSIIFKKLSSCIKKKSSCQPQNYMRQLLHSHLFFSSSFCILKNHYFVPVVLQHELTTLVQIKKNNKDIIIILTIQTYDAINLILNQNAISICILYYTLNMYKAFFLQKANKMRGSSGECTSRKNKLKCI